MTDKERYESVRHCRWVDEVVEDAPWVLTMEFLMKHKVQAVSFRNSYCSLSQYSNRSTSSLTMICRMPMPQDRLMTSTRLCESVECSEQHREQMVSPHQILFFVLSKITTLLSKEIWHEESLLRI